VSRRYPLAPLGSARQTQVRQRAGDLAERMKQTRRAVDEQRAAVRATAAERGRNRQVADEEAARLRAGRVRAADLVQAAQHRCGAEQRVRQLEEAQRATSSRVAAAEHDEARARAALADARAAAAVVDRHRERWQRDSSRRDENVQQEASDEVWASARHGRARRPEGCR